MLAVLPRFIVTIAFLFLFITVFGILITLPRGRSASGHWLHHDGHMYTTIPARSAEASDSWSSSLLPATLSSSSRVWGPVDRVRIARRQPGLTASTEFAAVFLASRTALDRIHTGVQSLIQALALPIGCKTDFLKLNWKEFNWKIGYESRDYDCYSCYTQDFTRQRRTAVADGQLGPTWTWKRIHDAWTARPSPILGLFLGFLFLFIFGWRTTNLK